jgi:hypothetical protein
MDEDLCGHCGAPLPRDVVSCPHCGRPSLFPNVRAAQDGKERVALAERYRIAVEAAAARGCAEVVRAFESTAGTSKAVIARPLRETERLASSDQQLYSTYYKLIEAGVQLPSGKKWDKVRQLADVGLFGLLNAPNIRFAALSTEDEAPASYGECCLVLREDRIAYRASLFEDNSAIFMAKKRYDLVPGYRATWEERAMLCVAKLAEHLQVDTPASRFSSLLMRSGATSEDDRFVEVHIWGSITRRTLQRVRIMSSPRDGRPGKTRLKALRDRLAEVGVPLEVA